MFSRLKSRRGETVVEVLIAVMLLVVGALSAVRLLALVGINNQLTKERVVATNLAREGLEAVRNIRDTNWLRFAGERRRCWNNADFSSPIECQDVNSDGVADEPITHAENYIAKFNTTNYRWELISTSDRLDFSDKTIDAVDEEHRLKEDANGLYNHAAGTDTIYFREIYTEYLDPDQSLALGESANVLRITSKVEWVDRGKFSNVTLTTILTDYLGRKNHN
jgi:hypothetical protein